MVIYLFVVHICRR